MRAFGYQLAHDAACKLYAFGLLIGNGDMHAGNLSFLHDGALPLEIAPIYDMLPMSFSPRTSGVIPGAAGLDPLALPSYPEPGTWKAMLPLAEQYWHQVQVSSLIDKPFRQEAAAMQARLEAVRSQLARLG